MGKPESAIKRGVKPTKKYAKYGKIALPLLGALSVPRSAQAFSNVTSAPLRRHRLPRRPRGGAPNPRGLLLSAHGGGGGVCFTDDATLAGLDGIYIHNYRRGKLVFMFSQSPPLGAENHGYPWDPRVCQSA